MVEFALKEEQTVDRALEEFLGVVVPPEEEKEEIFSLFTEWLIFNFCTQRTLSFLNEYILVNPDALDSPVLSEFREIAESHWYGGFEILKVKRGEFFQLEHLFSGRKIKVFDRLGSQNAPPEGTIVCRVAKVGGQHYLVGSNPLFLPLSHTQRMKKMMRERKQDFCSSPKQSLQLFLAKKEPPRFYNQREILKKRSELKKEYLALSERYPIMSPFADLIGRVYLEKRAESFPDILETLFKSEKAKEVIINNYKLLQDIWNFFPHKILRGKCPTELFQKNWRARGAPHKSHQGFPFFDRDSYPIDELKEPEEFPAFDDCPICQAMKRAEEAGENLTPSDLKKAFQVAKEGGAFVGGELPDDPNISLADFQHLVGKIGRPPATDSLPMVNRNKEGRNDPCPCGSGKKFKRCHGA